MERIENVWQADLVYLSHDMLQGPIDLQIAHEAIDRGRQILDVSALPQILQLSGADIEPSAKLHRFLHVPSLSASDSARQVAQGVLQFALVPSDDEAVVVIGIV